MTVLAAAATAWAGGADLSRYSNGCSVQDLDLNDFEDRGVCFECPLLPRHGHS